METKTLSLLCCTLVACVGCSAPTVNLSTAEPIKVDIAMRLDVFQHTKDQAKKSAASSEPAPGSDAESRRRNRMADIQNFKNSRLVGEGRDGLLSIRVDTPGDAGDYLRDTVAAENNDRMALMKSLSEKEKRSLADIQAEQATLWQKRSFEGELIEVAGPDGTFAWTAKSGR